MKVGVLGSGVVGKTLAKGFVKHGHEAMIGTRDVGKLSAWLAAEGQGVKAGSFADAAIFADLLVLSVKAGGATNALELAGRENLAGKTVIDTTNPINALRPPENGVLHFTTSLDHSLMESLQESFPETDFVKAFNSVGSAHMVDPAFDERPTMFICGNSPASKKEVAALLQQFGWEVCDMGKAPAARAIEPLCILWCIRGFNENKWGHAFKLLTKD